METLAQVGNLICILTLGLLILTLSDRISAEKTKVLTLESQVLTLESQLQECRYAKEIRYN